MSPKADIAIVVHNVPSEDMEAPDSLNSSVPIWMGKTRSWGRILGILEMSCGVDGGKWNVVCWATPLGVSPELDLLIAVVISTVA